MSRPDKSPEHYHDKLTLALRYARHAITSSEVKSALARKFNSTARHAIASTLLTAIRRGDVQVVDMRRR